MLFFPRNIHDQTAGTGWFRAMDQALGSRRFLSSRDSYLKRLGRIARAAQFAKFGKHALSVPVDFWYLKGRGKIRFSGLQGLKPLKKKTRPILFVPILPSSV